MRLRVPAVSGVILAATIWFREEGVAIYRPASWRRKEFCPQDDCFAGEPKGPLLHNPSSFRKKCRIRDFEPRSGEPSAKNLSSLARRTAEAAVPTWGLSPHRGCPHGRAGAT